MCSKGAGHQETHIAAVVATCQAPQAQQGPLIVMLQDNS
jgi:hypothetical protein